MAGSRRELKKIQPIVDRILALQPEMSGLSDTRLRARTDEFRRRLAAGETLDSLLPEAYAAVREAGKRVLGMEHFTSQITGGIILHQGRIAEMRTGEGKTLVSTLPAYLNALSGKGVHVVTVNDYLARRDCEQMGQIHEFLGLSVGAVLSGMSHEERRAAYACDITYVTNSELGFDYLRDNMATDRNHLVQRGFNFCIIDEVDSVLIDDAGTPLIISGQSERSTKLYEACDVLARRMTRGEAPKELSKLDAISGIEEEETGDYVVLEKEKRVILTAAGIRRTEKFFRIDNIADLENMEIQHHMNLALRANTLLEKDKDYVVTDGEVLIVDSLTGRIMQGRRYSDGLHQAIEAKEHVKIHKENRSVARVTYQNFFNKYEKLSGMTGTGRAQEKEFRDVYGMDIVEVPTHKPVLRIDKEDLFFRTKEEKLNAVCRDVLASLPEKRPVLVGTTSVADSEELSRRFTALGIKHNVLNAKLHAREAAIVAEAGKRGAVTIATNMAGRGTDIKLDADAKNAGGLLVIGTERADSRRIDDQLRGRSGRQGDPGESRFYLSMEDGLMKMYNSSRMLSIYNSANPAPGEGIVSPALSRLVEKAQQCVEDDNYASRRKLLEYDQILNMQRELLYERRLDVLNSDDMHSVIESLLKLAARDALDAFDSVSDNAEHVRMSAGVFDGIISPPAVAACGHCNTDDFVAKLSDELTDRFYQIEESFGDSAFLAERERAILLEAVDTQWTDHMEDMEQLRDGIGLVSYAQKDPVAEYQKSAYLLFEQMNRNIRHITAEAILKRPDYKVRT